MNKTELLALAERVEQADKGSWSLEQEIAPLLGWTKKQVGGVVAHYSPDKPDHMQAGPPEWTRSIDAALTLVPDGHFWSITMRGENRGGFHACCAKDGPLDWRDGAHPALAMTAAALRAIAGGADD